MSALLPMGVGTAGTLWVQGCSSPTLSGILLKRRGRVAFSNGNFHYQTIPKYASSLFVFWNRHPCTQWKRFIRVQWQVTGQERIYKTVPARTPSPGRHQSACVGAWLSQKCLRAQRVKDALSGSLLGFAPLSGQSWQRSSQVGRTQTLSTEYVPTTLSFGLNTDSASMVNVWRRKCLCVCPQE